MAKRELTGVEWINSPQKRVMDLTLCTLSAPLLLPIGALALGASRVIDGKGPLFSHKRLGQQGNLFNVYKIRTLKNTAPNEVGVGTFNPQSTRLGKVLRPLGVDEIPQVLNILKGDMSVVGPRVIYSEVFEAMEAAVPRSLYDEWLETYNLSKPGGISSAGIENRVANLQFEQLLLMKAFLDIKDFKSASFRYDTALIGKAATAIANLSINRLQAPPEKSPT